MSEAPLVLQARAKVNLFLRVLGRRADGYHDLETLFDRISLADTVTLTPRVSGIGLTSDVATIPLDATNLAWRGAAAALEAAGVTPADRGLSIHLQKGVPAGAGLGGGSADAAASLVGADALLRLGLSEETLLEAGRKVGADVPFFVHGHLRDRERAGSGRMAHGSGVGERLAVVPDPPPVFYVLTNPGFEVSTAWVFREGRFPEVLPRKRNDGGGEAPARSAGASLDALLAAMRNDLEPVTSARHPEIQELRQALLSVGALGARMSGSGPTVFGVFASSGDAARAGAELERRFAGTKVRTFVARGE